MNNGTLNRATWTVFGAIITGFCSVSFGDENILNKNIAQYVLDREAEFAQIPEERKRQLTKIADYLVACRDNDRPAHFIFICTHNSRRSHMAQLWAAVAAARHGLSQVETYSGGTEATAFNPRAVAALERAGFEFRVIDDGTNPLYEVTFAANVKAQRCFSKIYDSPPNPTEAFCAVMTCSSADQSCPNVSGAKLRVAIPYEDPKVADNTSEEASKYDERSAQIAREMLYAFARVK